jgi:hypothetical protein
VVQQEEEKDLMRKLTITLTVAALVLGGSGTIGSALVMRAIRGS